MNRINFLIEIRIHRKEYMYEENYIDYRLEKWRKLIDQQDEGMHFILGLEKDIP